MQDRLSPADRARLAALIEHSLAVAEELGATDVGTELHYALMMLTGEGVPPRG